MNRTRRIASLALGVAFLASLTLAGSVVAQETDTVQLQLTPSRGSGVSGTATITDIGGAVRIELNMRGLPEAGIEHINHFHAGGSCAADRAGNVAPATIPLKTIVAREDGTGSATTILKDVTLSQLFDSSKKRYIALHSRTKEGQGVPPVISCADIVKAAGTGGVPAALPRSGGMNPVLVISSGLALVLAAALAVRRRAA